MFESYPQTESFIIDAEVVAIDPATGALKTFQELSNRARKDVKLDEVKVAVCVFAFDIMFLDGQVNHRRCPVYVIVRLIQYLWAQQILLEKPFRERRALLRTRFPPYTPPKKGAARFDHVKSVESEQGREAVEEFWQTAVNSSTEGLMVKVCAQKRAVPSPCVVTTADDPRTTRLAQLLDSGEVLEEPNQKKDKPRRKPLTATYEPGWSSSLSKSAGPRLPPRVRGLALHSPELTGAGVWRVIQINGRPHGSSSRRTMSSASGTALISCRLVRGMATGGRPSGGVPFCSPSGIPTRRSSWRCANACQVSRSADPVWTSVGGRVIEGPLPGFSDAFYKVREDDAVCHSSPRSPALTTAPIGTQRRACESDTPKVQTHARHSPCGSQSVIREVGSSVPPCPRPHPDEMPARRTP